MSSNHNNAEPVATVVSGHTFTVDTRYVLKDAKILGKGSFGVVTTAYDSVRKIDLAIKRIRPYANDEWDARHTLREIRLLKLLGNHPNIITLFELSLFEPKTELYMMMELMDCDLHRVIQSKQPLSEKHHKCFVKQILEGIRAMHSIGVFHRDLKPGNILVSKDCQLRITDFGLARFMDEVTRQGENQQNPMTEYVVTRWYRCPELLLSPNRPYDEAIDLWSIGCILAELLRRKPLFPGKSHANQVQLIFEVMGFNSVKEMGFPVSAEAASFLEKRCRGRKQPWSKLFPDATIQAVELLESLLMLNPTDRPTAQEALQYSFFGDAETLYDYSLDYLKPPPANFFDFEMAKFTVPVLKEMIDNEVLLSSATGYRKPSIPTISVPALTGRDQQPLTHPHSESQTSRTDISSMSTAINPASSSHSSASVGGVPSQQHGSAVASQPPRRNPPQNAVAKANAAGQNNTNAVKPIMGYRRLSSDGQGFIHHGSHEEVSDGPVSQLSTQIRNFGVRGAGGNAAAAVVSQNDSAKGSHHGLASLNNPFRKQQSQPQVQPPPSSATEGSLPGDAGAGAGALSQPPALIYAPGTQASRSSQDAAGDIAVEDDNHAILGNMSNGGNILTSARNEPMPANVVAMMKVASAKKTPKTPSPKKMEQILQMDLNNKRRFMMQGLQKQQQQLQTQGQNPSQGSAVVNYSHNNGSVNASLGAKMPPPSSGLPFNNRNGNKKEDIASSSSSAVIGSNIGATSAAGNSSYNTRSSAAIIMNGGSNVIHNDYDIYANKKKQFTSADHGR